MPAPLPTWYDKGTILPSLTWQDFPVASHPSTSLMLITFEPYGDDAEIYPDGIFRYCMFRRKWLSPITCTEEAFFIWPQPESVIGWMRPNPEVVKLGFYSYIWQCRRLPSYNEQVYYVNIREQ